MFPRPAGVEVKLEACVKVGSVMDGCDASRFAESSHATIKATTVRLAKPIGK
jgi:hypothetical protein